MGLLTSMYLRHARQDGEAPLDSAIDIGKEVMDCGLWYLAGWEDGEFVLNRNPKEFALAQDFLFRQARFRHLKDEDVEQIIPERDREWTMIRKNWRID